MTMIVMVVRMKLMLDDGHDYNDDDDTYDDDHNHDDEDDYDDR
jgi:hypothetical protein